MARSGMAQPPLAQLSENPVYDVVGVGFGPANLALAIALSERNAVVPAADRLSVAFLERQSGFGWHRGMLIDGATMQVSFLKDLVTIRNPTSEYSFLAYLHDRGRLVDFVNHKCLFPSRVEFHDYLDWAASGFRNLVRYGHEVVDIRPVAGEGVVSCFDVVAHNGSVFRARNVVLAPGLEPAVPDGVELGDRVWHNRDLLNRVTELRDPRRVVVVGAGQSAAETVEFLHRKFAGAEVCAVFSRYGYSPADDSPFANRLFDPEAVEEFFSAPGAVKEMLMGYHRNTNYSVVDPELIEELYRRMYQEKVAGVRRLRLLNVSRVAKVTGTANGVRVAVESLVTAERSTLDADLVVYATGYRPVDPLRLLGSSGELCRRDADGRLRVARDYRVPTGAEVKAGIYLQGGTEHTHGITSSLLSNSAVRAGKIAGALVAGRAGAPADSPEYALTGD